MAEAVAAAASVAGLASLALQLTETVATLRRFYRSVRNASETLEELVDELETIALALREVERDVQRDDAAVGNAELLNRCLKSCHRGVKKLQDVVDKMTRLQTKSKGLGQLYIAIKAKDEEAILSDLERAKNSLAFTYQLYSEARRRADAERQVTAIRTLNQQVAMLPAEVVGEIQARAISAVSRHHAPAASYQMNEMPTVAGQFDKPYRGSKRSGRAFRVCIPIPFWQQVWHLSANRSISGWRMELQTYHIRPASAPIFEVLRLNDLFAMKQMFANGEASPYDRLSDGQTLLELAGRSAALDIVRYLLSNFRFADLDEVVESVIVLYKFDGNIPSGTRPSLKVRQDRSACHIEFFRAFLEQGSFEPLNSFSDLGNYGFYGGLNYFSSRECVDLFLPNLPVPLLSLPFQMRLNCAVHMESRDTLPEDFLRLCGLEQVTTELAAARTSIGITALHHAINAINDRWPSGPGFDAWTDFARSLIVHGADLHQARIIESGTPLMEFLLPNPGHRWLRSLLHRLRWWVDLVASASVDLLQYGAVETALLARHRDSYYSLLGIGRSRAIASIGYGPESADWTVAVRTWGEMPMYKKSSIPCEWTDLRIPRYIAWFPDWENMHNWSAWREGCTHQTDYRLWRKGNVKVFFDTPRDVRDVIAIEELTEIESLVIGTQDDHGILQLLISRSRATDRSFKRSKSQPAPIYRRKEAYCLPGRMVHHTPWLGSYHLCPSDGLHRYGCPTYTNAHGLDEPTFDTIYMALAECLQFNEGPEAADYVAEGGEMQSPWSTHQCELGV